MAVFFDIKELKLNENEQKEFKQVLSNANKPYRNSNPAAYEASCTFCNKIMHVNNIRMCIKCGHNICNFHAFISDPSQQFLTTFCPNCNPDTNNANDIKHDDSHISDESIRLNYILINDPCDYLLKQFPETEMIAALNYFLNKNNIKNALIIITSFLQQCPTPCTQNVYKYNDNYGCCHRGKKYINLCEYLFYYSWKIYCDYNFAFISPVIKAIETLEIDQPKKMKLIESIFTVILGFSCCSKNRFDDTIDHEMLALEWIKECNKIYSNCNDTNNGNLLLIKNIGCHYDVHFKRDNDELLLLSPIKYIEQCSHFQRIYSNLFWARTGYYPQQIINYINSQLNAQQNNQELKPEHNSNELKDDEKESNISVLRSVDIQIIEEWKKLKCEIFDGLFDQLMANRNNNADTEEIVYNMLFDTIIYCYDVVSTQRIITQNEFKQIALGEMVASVGGMYLGKNDVQNVGKVIWKDVLDAVKKKITETQGYDIGNVDLDYFIIKCCTILWNVINSDFVVYPLITECDDIICNESYEKQGQNTGNIIKYVVFPALRKRDELVSKIWVMCNN